MENQAHIKALFEKYLSGDYDRNDLDELLHYFDVPDEGEILRELIEKELGEEYDFTEIDKEIKAVDSSLRENLGLKKQKPRIRKIYIKYAAAAAILVFFVAGIYYSNTGKVETHEPQSVSQYGEDLEPGSNKAVITFSDGTTVELDGEKDGVIAEGKDLIYSDGTQVVATTQAIEYATLSTPRGGQYRLTLPDGSVVWLNSESSITYPTIFRGKKRSVKLHGEGYFEVFSDENKPFTVESDAQLITVTGTRFNVNSYTEEPEYATTLVEGHVKITDNKSGQSSVLAPGQQAVSDDSGMQVRNVDTDVYTAWKEGYFVFERTELSIILRQLSRWYNVDIDYSGVPEQTLTARIKRDKNISSVLNAIANTTGLDFYIKENKMILRK